MGSRSMPIHARRLAFGISSSSSTSRTRSTGMAKPMFSAAVFMTVLMPISSPWMFSSGPPELPRLMEASVWMRFEKRRSWACTSRCRPETMPSETVCSWP